MEWTHGFLLGKENSRWEEIQTKKKKKLTEQNPQLLTEILPQLKILAEIKGMTTHSSILAWRTPWIEEPGRL